MSKEKLVFPSAEWIAMYMEAVNTNKAYEEAAKMWEGDFIFQIDADGEVIKEPIRFYLDLWHGKCKAARMATADDKAEFIYSGPYSSWKGLFAGKIHPIKGIMQRKFALIGNYGKVMRATKAAMELVATAASIPTRFLDE